MMEEAINLAAKLDMFDDLWSPKIVGEFNGHDIMLVKVEGEFVWHKHSDTDDFFLVLNGAVTIETENGNVEVKQGEIYIVPRDVLHRPVAHGRAELLLIEPKNTPNTGDPDTATQKDMI